MASCARFSFKYQHRSSRMLSQVPVSSREANDACTNNGYINSIRYQQITRSFGQAKYCAPLSRPQCGYRLRPLRRRDPDGLFEAFA
jgi:hypothetical protein